MLHGLPEELMPARKPIKKVRTKVAKKTPEEQFPREWLPPSAGEPFKLWATMLNTDSEEGRGRDVPRAFFKTKAEALDYGKGQNTMGSDGKAAWFWVMYDVEGVLWLLDREIEIQENEEALKLAKAEEKARKHFSIEELELLGLKALA